MENIIKSILTLSNINNIQDHSHLELNLEKIHKITKNYVDSLKPRIPKPFEENKIYKTKFSTGEYFRVIQIIKNNKGDILLFKGIYESHSNEGICPLNTDRLYPEFE